MIETLLLASAMSGCLERDARSFEELVANRGRPVVECADRSYTEVFVNQSFSLDGGGNASVRFEFLTADEDAPTIYEIKPCSGFELGEDGIGESLLTEIWCNGMAISLVLGPASLQLRADGEQIYSYPVDTRFVIVNEMLYELARLERSD